MYSQHRYKKGKIQDELIARKKGYGINKKKKIIIIIIIIIGIKFVSASEDGTGRG